MIHNVKNMIQRDVKQRDTNIIMSNSETWREDGQTGSTTLHPPHHHWVQNRACVNVQCSRCTDMIRWRLSSFLLTGLSSFSSNASSLENRWASTLLRAFSYSVGYMYLFLSHSWCGTLGWLQNGCVCVSVFQRRSRALCGVKLKQRGDLESAGHSATSAIRSARKARWEQCAESPRLYSEVYTNRWAAYFGPTCMWWWTLRVSLSSTQPLLGITRGQLWWRVLVFFDFRLLCSLKAGGCICGIFWHISLCASPCVIECSESDSDTSHRLKSADSLWLVGTHSSTLRWREERFPNSTRLMNCWYFSRSNSSRSSADE